MTWRELIMLAVSGIAAGVVLDEACRAFWRWFRGDGT
jgi:hypothetical protein